MNLELNFRSGIPIYLQVVNGIKEMIANGRLNPGDQLPTVRALASDLRVNFNTIARSYRILDEAGIISTQQGRGTYILELPAPEAIERLRIESIDALARRYLNETLRLGFTPEQAIDHIRLQADNPNNEFSTFE